MKKKKLLDLIHTVCEVAMIQELNEEDTNKIILSNFYNVCGKIVTGKATSEEISIATKSMVDSHQTEVMSKEFAHIQEVLNVSGR